MHAKRQMFEDDFDVVRIFFEHLLEQRLNLAAEGSLKIRKHHHGDRRIFIADKG
jgi:hypothetical protein